MQDKAFAFSDREMIIAALACLCSELQDYTQADRYCKRLERMVKLAPRLADPRVPVPLSCLIFVYEFCGRYVRARRLCKRYLRFFRLVDLSDQANIARYLGILAGLSRKLGNYSDAERLYSRALALTEAAPVAGELDLLQLLHEYAVFCHETAR